MDWHLSAYNESMGSVTNSDVDAVADEVFTRRNSHLIFTEPYNLIGAYVLGSLTSRARFANAALTQKGTQHLWPIDVSATVPDDPAMIDLREYPMVIPQNEELTIEATTTGAGPSDVNVLLWIARPNWSRSLPPTLARVTTRATATIVAGAESAWTALADLVFERDLLNGVYAVIGAWVVAANAVAFRLRFPDQPSRGGKQLRPGGLVQDTAALAPWPGQNGGLGVWGVFHTFTPPEIQLLDDTAGGTYEVRLSLLYLGESPSLMPR